MKYAASSWVLVIPQVFLCEKWKIAHPGSASGIIFSLLNRVLHELTLGRTRRTFFARKVWIDSDTTFLGKSLRWRMGHRETRTPYSTLLLRL